MTHDERHRHEVYLWLVPIAGSAHVLEEYSLDWRGWVQHTVGIDGVTWEQFFLTNAAMVAILICHAAIGWRLPAVSLSGTVLIAINAVVFHILPTMRFQVYSPGIVTAVVLYLPLAWMVYTGARRDGVLTRSAAIGSVVIGAGMMISAALLTSHSRPS